MNLDDALDLVKGKAYPVGTVRNGREKVADGKWVPVKSGRSKASPEEEKPDYKGDHNQEEASRHMTEALKYKELENKLKEGIKMRKQIDPSYEAPEAAKEKLSEAKERGKAHGDDLKSKNQAAVDEANPNKDTDGVQVEETEQGRMNKVTDDEKAAIQEYKNAAFNSDIGGFTTIQGYLRNGKPKFGEANADEKAAAMDYAEKLSSAISKSPLKKDTKFHRGLKHKSGNAETQAIYDLKPGDTYSDKGFTSVSSSSSVANKFSDKLNASDKPIKMQFELPAGYNALNVKDNLGGKDPEKESILDKNSKFEVKSVKDSGGSRTIVFVPKLEKSAMKNEYFDLLDGLNKSLIMADKQGSAIDTADYTMDEAHAGKWLEIFQKTMENYNYGDVPREIELDKGYSIMLAKVDDGLYSGFIRQSIDWDGDSPLEETASKVEKQTIPAIIAFCKAKEYILPQAVMEDTSADLEVPQAIEMSEDPDVDYQIEQADMVREDRELANKLVNLLDRLI